jgi:hypothetical protein
MPIASVDVAFSKVPQPAAGKTLASSHPVLSPAPGNPSSIAASVATSQTPTVGSTDLQRGELNFKAQS